MTLAELEKVIMTVLASEAQRFDDARADHSYDANCNRDAWKIYTTVPPNIAALSQALIACKRLAFDLQRHGYEEELQEPLT